MPARFGVIFGPAAVARLLAVGVAAFEAIGTVSIGSVSVAAVSVGAFVTVVAA